MIQITGGNKCHRACTTRQAEGSARRTPLRISRLPRISCSSRSPPAHLRAPENHKEDKAFSAVLA